MSAVDALREGNLDRALVNLQDEVRASPADPKLRIFLFQLLSVVGQWQRALTQLLVVRDLDPAAVAMVRTYEQVLRCEMLRSQVFAGERTPLILGEPEPWIAQLIEALRMSAQGNYESSQRLRDEAYEQAPATAGQLQLANQPAADPSVSTTDSKSLTAPVSFEWLADADSRLGPVLEAIINGRYYWVPIQRIARIDIEPPTDLRDLVWLPARFLWKNQGDAVGMIPSRYPGSEASTDSQVQLGRRTEWTEPAPGVFQGIGQRLLATDQGEYAIMDIRGVQCGEAEAEPE
jgi:type VI secretion system protein ImpE